MKVAMIPARLGSQRVAKKNLRFLGDKPLVAWVLETVRDCGLFDAVYLNSESTILGELARQMGVKFYHRPESLAADHATSEHFVTDFLRNVPCEMCFQITPTSPFLTRLDLLRAVTLLDAGADTVVSVKEIQAECLFGNKGVNFNREAQMPPSQNLKSVFAFCNGIFGWRSVTFLERFYAEKAGTYGDPTNTAMLVLHGDSTIDIDSEQDFQNAEAIVQRRRSGPVVTHYWSPSYHAEANPADVLRNDGVPDYDDVHVGPPNLRQLILDAPDSCGVRVVQTPTGAATVIRQRPGEGNRLHYHPDLDEWWLILEGTYEYEIAGQKQQAAAGDIVVIPRGVWHRITATGQIPAVRLAVSRHNVTHVYHE